MSPDSSKSFPVTTSCHLKFPLAHRRNAWNSSLFCLSLLIVLGYPTAASAQSESLKQNTYSDLEIASGVIYKKAVEAYNLQRYTDCKKLLESFQQLISESTFPSRLKVPSQFLLAKCNYKLGNHNEAEKEIISAFSEYTTSGASQQSLAAYTCDVAEILIENKKGKEALEFLSHPGSEAIDQQPRVAYLTGLSKALLFDYDGAEDSMKKALLLLSDQTPGPTDLQDAQVQYGLGVILASNGHLEQAMDYLKQSLLSIEQHPTSILVGLRHQVLTELGIVQYRQKHYLEALKQLEAALAKTNDQFAASPPGSGNSFEFANETKVPSGDEKNIANAFHDPGNSIKYVPTRHVLVDDRALLALGVTLVKLQRLEEAEKILFSDHIGIATWPPIAEEKTQNKIDKAKQSLMNYQSVYRCEPLFLAEVTEAIISIALAKDRYKDPLPLPTNRQLTVVEELIETVPPLTEPYPPLAETNFLLTSHNIRRQLTELGLGSEKTSSIETARHDANEYMLRHCGQLWKPELFSGDSSSDLSTKYYETWKDVLMKNQVRAEKTLSALLKNEDFNSDKYRSQRMHSTVLLAYLLAEQGRFKESADWLAQTTPGVLADNDDDRKKDYLEFACFVNVEAERHSELVKLLPLLLRTTHSNQHSNQVASLLVGEYIKTSQLNKALALATKLVEFDEKPPKDIVDVPLALSGWKSNHACEKAQTLFQRAIVYNKLSRRVEALKDIERGYSLFTNPSSTLDKSLTELICSFRHYQLTKNDYIKISVAHGSTPKLPINRQVKICFQLDKLERADWKREFKTIAMSCFKDWEQVLDKKDWFIEVTDPSNADLSVCFSEGDCSGCNGMTTWVCSHNKRTLVEGKCEPYHPRIVIFEPTLAESNLPYTNAAWHPDPHSHQFSPRQKRELKCTLTHEMGHALGLEHSDSANDIMYWTGNFASISSRDANTLRRYYAVGQNSKTPEKRCVMKTK